MKQKTFILLLDVCWEYTQHTGQAKKTLVSGPYDVIGNWANFYTSDSTMLSMHDHLSLDDSIAKIHIFFDTNAFS